MRRKYESEEKTGAALEGKRGKGKAKAQACTPDSYSGIESVSSVQYQTTPPSLSEGSQQSSVQPVLVGEYPTHATVSLDVYEVRLLHSFQVKFSMALITNSTDNLVMLNRGGQLFLLWGPHWAI
jgi:hypothetical protein